MTCYSLSFLSLLQDGGGYVTDEELELCQTIEPSSNNDRGRRTSTASKTLSQPQPASVLQNSDGSKGTNETSSLVFNPPANSATAAAEAATSPSKEVLIGGDNNPSRR